MRRLRCSFSLSLQLDANRVAVSGSSSYRRGARQFHQSPYRRNNLIQSIYLDTVPPLPIQVLAAQRFFETHLPSKAWTATEWRQQPYSGQAHLIPEVVFLGRSNSGKSSLLNAVTNDSQLCRVGPIPGKTKTLHAWSLSPTDSTAKGARRGYGGDVQPKLTMLDMPGYGHGSHAEWGKGIMKYLTSRKQLRRAFVLVNPAHGLKTGDLQILDLLRTHGISHQFIACKCDHESIKNLPQMLENLLNAIKAHASSNTTTPLLLTVGDLLAVGALGDGKANHKTRPNAMKGLGDVRWAILRAASLDAYAMSLIGKTGPASDLTLSTQPDVVSNLHPVEPTPLSDTSTQQETRPVQPAFFCSPAKAAPQSEAPPRSPNPAPVTPKPPTIGIGMDALISMTSSSPSTCDSKSATPVSPPDLS